MFHMVVLQPDVCARQTAGLDPCRHHKAALCTRRSNHAHYSEAHMSNACVAVQAVIMLDPVPGLDEIIAVCMIGGYEPIGILKTDTNAAKRRVHPLPHEYREIVDARRDVSIPACHR